MGIEKPPEPEGVLEKALREKDEQLDKNKTEIAGIKRQFPTLPPPKKYQQRLDELEKENKELEEWIRRLERQIDE